jgi:hypothetical protein
MISSGEALLLRAFSRNRGDVRKILRRAERAENDSAVRRRRDAWRIEIAVFWLLGLRESPAKYVAFPVLALVGYLYAIGCLAARLLS